MLNDKQIKDIIGIVSAAAEWAWNANVERADIETEARQRYPADPIAQRRFHQIAVDVFAERLAATV